MRTGVVAFLAFRQLRARETCGASADLLVDEPCVGRLSFHVQARVTTYTV